MKFAGMPLGMWLIYKKSFRNKLVSILASGGPYCDCGYKKKFKNPAPIT